MPSRNTESEAFRAIKSALPRLRPEEKTKLAGLLALMGAKPSDGYGEEKPTAESNTDLLYREIGLAVFGYGSDSSVRLPPLKLLPKSVSQEISKACGVLDREMESEAFLIRSDQRSLSRNQRRALYGVFARLAAARLREVGGVVSVRSVAQQSANFSGLLDRAFPGYLPSGLLGWVLPAR